MKKITPVGILLFLLVASAGKSFAQEPLKNPFAETVSTPTPRIVPPWVSDKGYWQVETNIHHRRHYIVSFYNNDRMLVYKKTVDGVRLNLSRARTKMVLKAQLEEVIAQWGSRLPPYAPDSLISYGSRLSTK